MGGTDPVKIIKKDGREESFDASKILSAVGKSANRAMAEIEESDMAQIVKYVYDSIRTRDDGCSSVERVHLFVEQALDIISPETAKAYRDYRNYKTDFVHMLDEVYQKAQSIRYIGDRSNANSDSALVSTQRSLIYQELNSELYKKFFLNKEELEAMKAGYIYIHDRSARLDSVNCCLFDMAKVIAGGFEMGNVWYNEPKTLDVAFDVISDVTMSAAAMQYGK